MKIWTLLENTACDDSFCVEHGLSLYIETEKHNILFDTGASDAFCANAEKLGVDLSRVDIAVLSHGHFDHGGGLAAFLARNKTAPVYLHRDAFLPHFNVEGKDIGIDESLRASERLVFTDDELVIDEELSIFSCNTRERHHPSSAAGMLVKEGSELRPDEFLHEQYLLISEGEKRVLLSGCSHKGVINITEWFAPDVLIGGFHFMKLDTERDAQVMCDAAEKLLAFKTRYYTGHCTGEAQYAFLKALMGERLSYLATGSVIEI